MATVLQCFTIALPAGSPIVKTIRARRSSQILNIPGLRGAEYAHGVAPCGEGCRWHSGQGSGENAENEGSQG